jgi:hypothetical protein
MIRLALPPKSPFTYAAVVSLDPSGSGISGVSVRLTSTLQALPPLDKLRAPDFVLGGDVWEPMFHDQITEYLFRYVGEGQRALLVVEDAAYRSYKIARSLGTAIGSIKSSLVYCNLARPDDVKFIAPKSWRTLSMPGVKCADRDAWKQAAIDTVKERYDLTLDDNAAESVLINDAVAVGRKDWWAKKARKAS